MVPIDRFLEDCPPVLADLLFLQSMTSSMAQKKECFDQAHCLAIVPTRGPQTLETALEKLLSIINSLHRKGYESQMISEYRGECKSCYVVISKKSYSRGSLKFMGSTKDPVIKADKAAIYFQAGCSYGLGFGKSFMKKRKTCLRNQPQQQQPNLISKMAFVNIHSLQNWTNKFCLHKIENNFFLKDYIVNNSVNNPFALIHQLKGIKIPAEFTLYRSSEFLLARMVEFYLEFTPRSSSEPAFIDTRSSSISLTTAKSYTNEKSICNCKNLNDENKSKDCQESDELNAIGKTNCTKCIVINICDMEKPRSCLRRHLKGQDLGQDIGCDEVDVTSPKIDKKKVKFAPPNKLCEVHPMIKWAYAYQEARKGPWEMHARDRDRFRWRIFRTEQDIKNVFEWEHRSKIYRERFEDV